MRGWRRSGAAQRWRAAARRDASSSPSGSRTSTQEPRTPQASLGFPRHVRITRGAELQRIAREGKRIRAGHLDVRVVASPLAHSAGARMRVGLIVPRYRHSAVARNQLKRRLRELTRLRLLPGGLAYDVVVRTRPDTYDATFEQLSADVDRVLAQLSRWASTGAPLVPVPPAPPTAPSAS